MPTWPEARPPPLRFAEQGAFMQRKRAFCAEKRASKPRKRACRTNKRAFHVMKRAFFSNETRVSSAQTRVLLEQTRVFFGETRLLFLRITRSTLLSNRKLGVLFGTGLAGDSVWILWGRLDRDWGRDGLEGDWLGVGKFD